MRVGYAPGETLQGLCPAMTINGQAVGSPVRELLWKCYAALRYSTHETPVAQ